jgi:hypothetical protein
MRCAKHDAPIVNGYSCFDYVPTLGLGSGNKGRPRHAAHGSSMARRKSRRCKSFGSYLGCKRRGQRAVTPAHDAYPKSDDGGTRISPASTADVGAELFLAKLEIDKPLLAPRNVPAEHACWHGSGRTPW